MSLDLHAAAEMAAGGIDRFAFAPDPRRTALVTADVRRALGDSVAQVLAALEAAGAGGPRPGLATWRRALESNPRPSPRLWAVYHAMVQAALADEAEAATVLADELLSRDAAAVGPREETATFSPRWLGGDTARCLAVVDNDPANPLHLAGVDEAEVERLAALGAQARALMAESSLALLDEVDALGHQRLLGVGRGRARFGGAASIFLWGAVVLNPERVHDRVALVEALAHETAHALLFGLTLGADLTTNGPGERFSSPLRADPRPIEGILHAAYVLARMVDALRRLRDGGGLDAAERDDVQARIDTHLALHHGGVRTVDAHARLTPEGAEILDACRRHMRAHA